MILKKQFQIKLELLKNQLKKVVDAENSINFSIQVIRQQLIIMKILKNNNNVKEVIFKLSPQNMEARKRKLRKLSSVMSSKNNTDQCEEKDVVHKNSLLKKARKTEIEKKKLLKR